MMSLSNEIVPFVVSRRTILDQDFLTKTSPVTDDASTLPFASDTAQSPLFEESVTEPEDWRMSRSPLRFVASTSRAPTTSTLPELLSASTSPQVSLTVMLPEFVRATTRTPPGTVTWMYPVSFVLYVSMTARLEPASSLKL